MRSQVQREPLSAQVADLLYQRISAGEWDLGSRLPPEPVLALQLGVGRSTLREAVRQLSGRGMLEPRQGAGVFVAALEAPEERDLALRRSDIASVLEARIAIETEAAALAAVRRTPAELRQMRRALTHRVEQGRSVEEYVDADTTLHRAIVEASHNPVLLGLFDSFVPRVRQVMVSVLHHEQEHPFDGDDVAHTAIIDAIAEHRRADAALASRTHLETVKAQLR